MQLTFRESGAKELVTFQKRVAGLSELTLSRFTVRARRAVGLKGAVDVLVTANEEMKSLNQRFRGKDKATDVLSFAPPPDSLRKRLAGEIAISAEIAAQNAHALGHTAAQEVKILVLHGILHLSGYDHERDNGLMARRESQLRSQLRLPVGLIERASGKRVAAGRSAAKMPQTNRRARRATRKIAR